MDSLSVKKNCRSLEMVTTQVAPDSESTCGTAECVVSLNTNLSNLTNRAELNLQVGGNSIRVSFYTNLSNLTNRAGWNLQVGGNSIRVSFNTNLSNLTNRAG